MHNLREFLIKKTQFHHQFLVITCAAFRRTLSTKASFFRPRTEQSQPLQGYALELSSPSSETLIGEIYLRLKT